MGNISTWLTQTLCPEEQLAYYAARTGDAHLLRKAIATLTTEKRHYLEWHDTSGLTALAQACIHGYNECVEILMAAGADCRKCDFEGNGVLHLAARYGRSDVVHTLLDGFNPAGIAMAGCRAVSAPTRVDMYARNAARETALDIARREHFQAENGAQHAKCMELLEKKSCVHLGWLYQRVDNLISMASGFSALNSWKRRYCMVLMTSAEEYLEIDLFAMKPGEKRPARPSFEYMYRVTDRVQSAIDTKWFNRKEHTFSIKVSEKGKSSTDLVDLELAAITASDLVAWRLFLTNAQSIIQQRRHGAVAESASPISATWLENREVQEAVHRSLQDAAPMSTSSPIVSSAPPWNDFDVIKASFGPDGVEIAQPLNVTDQEEEKNENECVVCFDAKQSAVCVPCGHQALCMECASEIMTSSRMCPVCRVSVREIIRLYRV